MSRYECVADQKASGFPVTKACEVAEMSTSGFYDWSKREAAPPTERELRHGGVVVNENRVRRLMRAGEGIVGDARGAEVLGEWRRAQLYRATSAPPIEARWSRTP